ncbi:MAG: hypothetical protein V4543_08840 [Bacteroidota bacterium]
MASFPGSARVWVYQADTALSPAAVAELDNRLSAFCAGWQSHGTPLSAAHVILHNTFILLAVDQEMAGASGCSIDKSVQVLREAEQALATPLLSRDKVAFLTNGEIKSFPLSGIKKAVSAGEITADSLLFNNMVTDLQTLRNEWLPEAGKTWAARHFRVSVNA